MQLFVNSEQQAHRGRHEMFRGRLVPCVEVPERQQQVLDELQRRGIGSPWISASIERSSSA
jgi:hypothetical protein